MNGKEDKYDILLVEDSEGDIMLTKEAIENTGLELGMTVMKNGEDAISYFKRSDSLPHLILLDINLPKISGLEVLKFIKTTEILKCIPVVMLTTSDSDRDIQSAYENHCNYYLQKPVELEYFFDAIKVMINQWFMFTNLPSISGGRNIRE